MILMWAFSNARHWRRGFTLRGGLAPRHCIVGCDALEGCAALEVEPSRVAHGLDRASSRGIVLARSSRTRLAGDRARSVARVVTRCVHATSARTAFNHRTGVSAGAAIEHIRFARDLVAAAICAASHTAAVAAARVVLSRADFASVGAVTECRRCRDAVTGVERVRIAANAIASAVLSAGEARRRARWGRCWRGCRGRAETTKMIPAVSRPADGVRARRSAMMADVVVVHYEDAPAFDVVNGRDVSPDVAPDRGIDDKVIGGWHVMTIVRNSLPLTRGRLVIEPQVTRSVRSAIARPRRPGQWKIHPESCGVELLHPDQTLDARGQTRPVADGATRRDRFGDTRIDRLIVRRSASCERGEGTQGDRTNDARGTGCECETVRRVFHGRSVLQSICHREIRQIPRRKSRFRKGAYGRSPSVGRFCGQRFDLAGHFGRRDDPEVGVARSRSKRRPVYWTLGAIDGTDDGTRASPSGVSSNGRASHPTSTLIMRTQADRLARALCAASIAHCENQPRKLVCRARAPRAFVGTRCA